MARKGTDVEVDYGRPYVGEIDYIGNDYDPIGQQKDHFCIRCKQYYAGLKQRGITSEEFIPSCVGDISDYLTEGIDEESVDPDDLEMAKIYANPIEFAMAQFNWDARWYQEPLLLCSSKKKVIRAGRRSGKSEALVLDIAYNLYTNRNYSIILVCPYQSQIKVVFDKLRRLINDSVDYQSSIKRDVSSPHYLIELNNGSALRGFSSGSGSGKKSNQIRGQDANAVYLDEADYLTDEDLESIMAILASHPDCRLWASSTPSGARNHFFNWAVNKDLRFKEFHFISAEAPTWTDETEIFFRDAYSDMGYLREFLAEFGEEMQGVFRNADINKSLINYEYESCRPTSQASYCIGVDWNKNTGTHIIVLECSSASDDVKYRVVDKLIIEKHRFTQINAVKEIIRMTSEWNAEHVYVDAGYGETQVEMLHKFGIDNPRSKMDRKVKAIQMGGNEVLRDPKTGVEIKKPTKSFVVNIAARQMEAGRCIMPRSEDTRRVINQDDLSADIGLVQQMRNFKVTKISPKGIPTYSQDYEHTLTAWMLAIYAFVKEKSDFSRYHKSSAVAYAGKIGEPMSPEEAKNRSEETRKKNLPAPRVLGDKAQWTEDLLSGMKRDARLRNLQEKQQKSGIMYKPRGPGSRSNF